MTGSAGRHRDRKDRKRMSQQKRRLGFIGLGQMGAPIAVRLLEAGYRVTVHTRTRTSAARVQEAGARWVDSVAEVARAADVILTMLGMPDDVRQIYLGDDGLLAHGRAGQVCLDLTTSSACLAAEIAARAEAIGIAVLDAPVSGGVPGARAGTLSIMVGGDAAAFARMRSMLERVGATICRFGGPGAGQRAKACNQIVIAGTMMGVCEGLALAGRAGLQQQDLLRMLAGGAAGGFLVQHMGPRIVAGDYRADFYVRHFLKDLGIALREAERLKLVLPATELAHRLYARLEKEGSAALGTQALATLYGPESMMQKEHHP
ncbi:NAD(P)-dependent oxidoreductase [Gluconacetobacter aggeris]|uniref:NAD(P)-dependent oxidoreductase n=2 Tax=Gluconacetobacter aggeris TaxID=1286186 RepID=A0A7W4IVL0_9PROT|nr:NAD(P)-dependent oxidoreductase [Gluconacetobacter aggeris]